MGDFTTSADEVIAVINDTNEVISKATRKEVHTKGLLHREAYVYLINPNKKVLLQKRADNNKWDHSVGCHFAPEESYLEAAQRETEEEIGLKLDIDDFKEIGTEKFEKTKPGRINRRIAKIFFVKKDISMEKLKIDRDAIAEVRYFSSSQLKDLLNSNEDIASSARIIISKYILPIL